MPYAFVAQVKFEGNADPDEGRRMLHDQVIPGAKAQPGFQRGVWLRSLDGTTGIGTVIFDTEANAKAASESIPAGRPANAPTITNSGVYEVMGEA